MVVVILVLLVMMVDLMTLVQMMVVPQMMARQTTPVQRMVATTISAT